MIFVNVGVAGFTGRALRIGTVRSIRLSFEIDVQVPVDKRVYPRLNCLVGLFDEESEVPAPPSDEHKLAVLECEIVCEYLTDAEPTVFQDESMLKSLIERRTLPDIFPYLRELVSSMSSRLGFQGVVLQPFGEHELDDAVFQP